MGRELPVDAAHAAEGARGVYGLDENAAGPRIWALLQGELDALGAWYTDDSNCERPCAKLSLTTMQGHTRAVLYYTGYCSRFRQRVPTMACFLDGALIQSYAAFLRARGCAASTITKVLGQVRHPGANVCGTRCARVVHGEMCEGRRCPLWATPARSVCTARESRCPSKSGAPLFRCRCVFDSLFCCVLRAVSGRERGWPEPRTGLPQVVRGAGPNPERR